MRTTLDIDDDVLEAVKTLARRTKSTAGAVLSDLARQALMSTPRGARKRRPGVATGGFEPFKKRGGVVTNALIDKLREQGDYGS